MMGSTCRMLAFVRKRPDAERLERPGWILVAISHRGGPGWDKDAIWMRAESPQYLRMHWISSDKDYDKAQPFYTVNKRMREYLFSEDNGTRVNEIIRPDLLQGLIKRQRRQCL